MTNVEQWCVGTKRDCRHPLELLLIQTVPTQLVIPAKAGTHGNHKTNPNLVVGAGLRRHDEKWDSYVCARTLGSVDIQRSQIMAPTKDSMAANDSAVFSYRVAIRRKCLILLKNLSTRLRSL